MCGRGGGSQMFRVQFRNNLQEKFRRKKSKYVRHAERFKPVVYDKSLSLQREVYVTHACIGIGLSKGFSITLQDIPLELSLSRSVGYKNTNT